MDFAGGDIYVCKLQVMVIGFYMPILNANKYIVSGSGKV